MPVSVLSRLVARLVRDVAAGTTIVVAAGITAVAFATASASPAWAGGPQDVAHGHGKTAAGPAAAPDLNPDGTVPDAVTKTGVRTRVVLVWNCAMPDQIPVVFARADHGTISIDEVKGSQCGHPSMTLAGVFYTSEPGFKGTDKVYVLGFLLEGKIDQTVTVLVK